MRYAKPHTSLQEQIQLLTDRGMLIANPAAALTYLSHIGYFRLRGYWIPFEVPGGQGDAHRFREGTTFDQVLNSHWISNLKHKSDKAKIAKVYGLDEAVLTSFLHHLSVIRNHCAHHARLWNREMTVTMELPRKKPASLIPSLDVGPDRNQAPRRIYNILVILAYLMDCISPGHHWKQRLFELIERHRIDAKQMGFPADYLERPIWGT